MIHLRLFFGRRWIVCAPLRAGYCEQFDTHSSGTTVAEAVEISALLRLSKNISKEQVWPAFVHASYTPCQAMRACRQLCWRIRPSFDAFMC